MQNYQLLFNRAGQYDVILYFLMVCFLSSEWQNCYTSVAIYSSFAEPPLFWTAPAPEERGPGAYSGSDQIGSAPAQKFVILSSYKVNY